VRFALTHPQRFRLMFERGGSAGLRQEVEAAAGAEARGAARATWALVHGLAQLILAGQFADLDADALLRETLAAVRFAQRSA
jgi:hypothetical protein